VSPWAVALGVAGAFWLNRKTPVPLTPDDVENAVSAALARERASRPRPSLRQPEIKEYLSAPIDQLVKDYLWLSPGPWREAFLKRLHPETRARVWNAVQGNR
jgi:hypothetical protein